MHTTHPPAKRTETCIQGCTTSVEKDVYPWVLSAGITIILGLEDLCNGQQRMNAIPSM